MCRFDSTGTTRPLSTKRESTRESPEGGTVIKRPTPSWRTSHKLCLGGTHYKKAPTLTNGVQGRIGRRRQPFLLANDPRPLAGREFRIERNYTDGNLPIFVFYRIGYSTAKHDRRLMFAIYLGGSDIANNNLVILWSMRWEKAFCSKRFLSSSKRANEAKICLVFFPLRTMIFILIQTSWLDIWIRMLDGRMRLDTEGPV